MKTSKKLFTDLVLILIVVLLFTALQTGQSKTNPGFMMRQPVNDSVHVNYLNANNIYAWMFTTGIFNKEPFLPNSPGFQWPYPEPRHLIYAMGMTIIAYVDGNIRMGAASFKGEYLAGKTIINNGNPIGYTDPTFKIYKVSKNDNCNTNPDWANWGLMVPYGAPYVDVNMNGKYEPCLDIPGVKDAEETIFVHITDAFPERHNPNEGFGGGTAPLYADIGITYWGYQGFAVNDANFIKWNIINKGTESWDSSYFGIISDPDLGDPTDDYIGCDTTLDLSYAYNFDNNDGNGGPYTYGLNPPATGFLVLKSPKIGNDELGLTSSTSYENRAVPFPQCELDPEIPLESYRMVKGYKTDGTVYLNPEFTPPTKTKFLYPGDPETGTGWTQYTGRIPNCGGDTTGKITPIPGSDRRIVMGMGSQQLNLNPGDTTEIIIAQLVARGNSNLNSVTKLKELAAIIKSLYEEGFVNVGINQISSTIPKTYSLTQNYPNPFNPKTIIGFGIPKSGIVRLKVYDITGREVATLINENLNPGTYSVDFDGSKLSSGMYFYTLETAGYRKTKKMVLLK